MWEAALPAIHDPLRQGDLLDGVVFPMLKHPLQQVKLEGTAGVLVPAKSKPGLVVSQCCDNEAGEYVAIAQVQPTGGLTPEQLDALHVYELPGDGFEGYILEMFLLEPVDGVLDPTKMWIASLVRTAVFWGPDCAALTALRRKRMTPQARRHLRLNLGALWARAEESDAALLAESQTIDITEAPSEASTGD